MNQIMFTMTMTKARYDKALFKAVGQAVSNRRSLLQRSYEDMEAMTRLQPAFIKEMEAGLRNVNVGVLSKVCSALDCSISELMSDAEAQMQAMR